MTSKQSNRCGAKHKHRLMTVKMILEEESDRTHRFSVKQLLDRLDLPHTEANQARGSQRHQNVAGFRNRHHTGKAPHIRVLRLLAAVSAK